MKLTGHKTSSVYQRYNIVSDRDLEEAAKKVTIAQSVQNDYPKTDF